MSYEIPKVQKAIVVTKIQEDCQVEVDNNYPVPVPSHGELLVRLTSSGVCHSDISLLQNHWPLKMTAKVSGHEGSGYIVQHGPGVDSSKYPLGMRVGVALQDSPCYACFCCTTLNAINYCSKALFYGTQLDGTWQQYCIIKETNVLPIPDGIDSTLVGPILCSGITVYRSLKETELRPGQWVVVAGCGGGLGSMAIQFAKAFGLKVIGIDSGEKKEFSEKLGCDCFVDFRTQDVVETILKATNGRGANGVLMLVPSAATYNQAPDYMAMGATMVCVGLPKEEARITISPITIAAKKLKLVGTYFGTNTDILEALEFVKEGLVTPHVTVVKMEDCQSVVEDMKQGKVSGRIVFDLE